MRSRHRTFACLSLALGIGICACALTSIVACNDASLKDTSGTTPMGTPADPNGTPDPSMPGTSGAPAPGTDGGPPVVVEPDSVSVIVEPADKAQALLSAIQAAKSSVHMTMYLLDDKRFIEALIVQHQAGRDVKVILNQTFPMGAGSNQAAYNSFVNAGVPVVWASTTYTLTHEKCVVIDGSEAWIMTMNLEVTSSTKNREFLAVDTQKPDVMEAEAVFAADFAHTALPMPTGDLLVAPVNARDRLVTLIQGAKQTVDLEGEELSDYKVVNALVAAKQAGVTVHVVLADDGTPAAAQTTAVGQLKTAGIPVVKLSAPYVHAKAIVADGKQAYVGSENFTTGSLQYNRELGVITSNAPSVASVGQTIAQDFAAGTAL